MMTERQWQTYLDVNGHHAATSKRVSVGAAPRRPVRGCQRQHLRKAKRVTPAPTRSVHDSVTSAEGPGPVGARDAGLSL